jgi:hydrogenase maturation protease
MEALERASTLVIGVGNTYRGDDAIGLLIAQHLKIEGPDGLRVEASEGNATELLELWKKAEIVIVVDAVCSGGTPGTIYRLDATSQPVPARFFNASTHNFGVAEAIELGRVLEGLPPRLLVYGVEGKQFELGAALSLEVEKVIEPLLEQIRAEIG